jgi:hypothetical protein
MCEAHHSSPFDFKVKNAWSYTSSPEQLYLYFIAAGQSRGEVFWP